jgi:hypothetical protein
MTAVEICVYANVADELVWNLETNSTYIKEHKTSRRMTFVLMRYNYLENVIDLFQNTDGTWNYKSASKPRSKSDPLINLLSSLNEIKKKQLKRHSQRHSQSSKKPQTKQFIQKLINTNYRAVSYWGIVGNPQYFSCGKRVQWNEKIGEQMHVHEIGFSE